MKDVLNDSLLLDADLVEVAHGPGRFEVTGDPVTFVVIDIGAELQHAAF